MEIVSRRVYTINSLSQGFYHSGVLVLLNVYHEQMYVLNEGELRFLVFKELKKIFNRSSICVFRAKKFETETVFPSLMFFARVYYKVGQVLPHIEHGISL